MVVRLMLHVSPGIDSAMRMLCRIFQRVMYPSEALSQASSNPLQFYPMTLASASRTYHREDATLCVSSPVRWRVGSLADPLAEAPRISYRED